MQASQVVLFGMALGALPILAPASSPAPAAQRVPTTFRHDRVFVETAAPDGARLTWFTDTGGGWNAVAAPVAERYALREVGCVDVESGTAPLVAFPDFLRLPAPLDESWLHGGLVVVPARQLDADGVLGSRWFAGKAWRIDYAQHTLERLPGDAALPRPHRTPLHFRPAGPAGPALYFPRLTVRVDGKPIALLLDTGATARLTAAAATATGMPSGSEVGTSYISTATFDAWNRRHPGWRVVEGAEDKTGTAFRMIEVAQIEVAGLRVGPVWFTERPTPTFRQWMSPMTDAPIDGALGGSALRYFRVVLDYRRGVAVFAVAK